MLGKLFSAQSSDASVALPTTSSQPKPARRRADESSVASRSRVGFAPGGSQKRSGQLTHRDAETHARALYETIREAGYAPGYQLNYRELSKIYREMCELNRWYQRGWVSVGRAFDLLTTNGEKPYANFWGEDGRAQRLRVYPIPTEKVAPEAALRVA